MCTSKWFRLPKFHTSVCLWVLQYVSYPLVRFDYVLDFEAFIDFIFLLKSVPITISHKIGQRKATIFSFCYWFYRFKIYSKLILSALNSQRVFICTLFAEFELRNITHYNLTDTGTADISVPIFTPANFRLTDFPMSLTIIWFFIITNFEARSLCADSCYIKLSDKESMTSFLKLDSSHFLWYSISS